MGLLTGWGAGVAALRPEPGEAATGLVPVPTPALDGERFRRATRECLLAVAAVKAALADAGLDSTALAGDRTGILYASATGYAAANRAFLEGDGAATLHFPYTSPSAVPGEVTIEFGMRGPYVNLMGGGTAALQGLWYAARWLAEGAADRVVLLAVEAVHEVRDLFARARRLYTGPLLEGAACLLLEPAATGPTRRDIAEPLRWASAVAGARASNTVGIVLDAVLGAGRPGLVATAPSRKGPGRTEERELARRGVDAPRATASGLGEALAAAPLHALAEARALSARGPWLLTATWQDEYGAMLWPSPRA